MANLKDQLISTFLGTEMCNRVEACQQNCTAEEYQDCKKNPANWEDESMIHPFRCEYTYEWCEGWYTNSHCAYTHLCRRPIC